MNLGGAQFFVELWYVVVVFGELKCLGVETKINGYNPANYVEISGDRIAKRVFFREVARIIIVAAARAYAHMAVLAVGQLAALLVDEIHVAMLVRLLRRSGADILAKRFASIEVVAGNIHNKPAREFRYLFNI